MHRSNLSNLMKFVKTNLLICNWPSSLRKSYVFFVMIIVRLLIMYSTNIICFLLGGYTLLCMSTSPVDTFPNSGVTYSTSSKSPSTDELVAVVASAPQRDNRAREFRCRKAGNNQTNTTHSTLPGSGGNCGAGALWINLALEEKEHASIQDTECDNACQLGEKNMGTCRLL